MRKKPPTLQQTIYDLQDNISQINSIAKIIHIAQHAELSSESLAYKEWDISNLMETIVSLANKAFELSDNLDFELDENIKKKVCDE